MPACARARASRFVDSLAQEITRQVPGLWALRRGAALVAFSDFDEGVLRELTSRDAFRELRLRAASEREDVRDDVGKNNTSASARFYAGDWSATTPLLVQDDEFAVSSSSPSKEERGRFDLVLTAETTYREDTARAVAQAIARHLSRPSGVAFVATKRYYFGTGGGTRAFVAALPSQLRADVVSTFEDGASNLREILRVTWRAELKPENKNQARLE